MSDPQPPEDEEKAFDASDQSQVDKRKSKSKQRDTRRINGFRQLVESADGRLWLWDFLGHCGVFRSSIDANPVVMAANEGQRNIGLLVIRDLTKHAPDAYLLMMKENDSDN